MGISLSEKETLGPATSLDFLDLTLDNWEIEVSLTQDKVQHIHEITWSILSLTSIAKRQLLFVLGHLNFAMCVSPQGRSFMSHLRDLASSILNLLHSVSLDEGCHSDLCFFMMTSLVLLTLQFFTDAAPSISFGGQLVWKQLASWVLSSASILCPLRFIYHHSGLLYLALK